MAQHEFDKSSKWLIQKHGDGILYLGGVRGVRKWRALQAELVQPRRLPDGLLEVYFHGCSLPDYFLLEVSTYPEKRILEQALDDLTLAYHHLRVLPELLTVVLFPKGKFEVLGEHTVASRLQWSQLACRWKVVKLWELSGEELLAAGDVGLVPWVALTRFQGPPTPILEQCRRQIEQQAKPDERDNLLAVSQILAQLRYNNPELLSILGGRRVMIESPLIKEIVAESEQKAKQETKREDLLDFLEARFDKVSEEIEERLRAIGSEKKLKALIKYAGRCPNLAAFRKRLFS
jgi:hypothetical protein